MADFPKQPGWSEAQQAAAQEKLNKVLKETGDLQRASIEASLAGARAAGETVEQLRAQLELLKDLQTEQKVSLEQKTLEAELRKAEAMAARKEYRTQVQEYQRLAGIKRKAEEDFAEQKKDAREEDAEALKDFEDAVTVAEENIEKHKELLKAKKEIADATAEEVDNQDELNDAMKLTHRNAENLAGSMANAFAIAGVNNYAKGIYLAVDAMRTAGGWAKLMQRLPEALFSQMISNIVGMSMSIVDMEAGFRKATGASEEFAGAVTKTYDQTRQFGVSAEDASKATQDLYNSYTDFTFLNESTRVELQNTVAVLGEFGIATSDLAQGTQNATKMLGVNVNQVEELHRELFTYAENIGVAPQKMAKEFAAAGPALAKFGNQGVKAFKDLERTAKITGMEMNKILNLTNKFDTFESAAEMTGKLNAALGGNFVNAMDMMMETDPAARFETIRNAITDAGLSFDTMSYYQKQFYAESLGMSDVGDLALMLSGNMSTLDGANQKSSKEYEVLAAQALKVQKVSEQWAAAMADLTPVLGGLITLVRISVKVVSVLFRVLVPLTAAWLAYTLTMKLATAAEATNTTVTKFSIGWIRAKGIALWDLVKATNAQSIASALAGKKTALFTAALVALGVIGLMMSSPSLLVAALFALGAAIFAAGRASETSTLSIQALAVPMMQLGVGVFLATAGLAAMAGAFAMMDLTQIVGLGLALGILVAAVVAMGFFGAAAAPGILAVGLAMIPLGFALLMVGTGVGIAAAGVGLMAAGFSLMFKAIDIEKIGAFIAMVGVMGIAAIVIPLAAAGMFALASSLTTVAIPLFLVSKSMLVLGIGIGIAAAGIGVMALAARKMVDSMSKLGTNSLELVLVSTAFEDIAEAIDGVPIAKTVLLTTLTKGMQALAVSAGVAGPTALQRVAEIIDVVTPGTAGGPAAAGVRAAAAAAGGGATGTKLQNVTVQLDEKATRALLEGKAATGLAKMAPGFISNNLPLIGP